MAHPPATNGASSNDSPDKRQVFFFDIDNCLYSKSLKIHERMSVLIDEYFQSHLELTPEDAGKLHSRYYQDYGLALEGLVRHHRVDPLEYNARVDDALPLEEIIHPDPKLRQLLEDIDRSKFRLWLFTNAYVTHGKRVVRLLGVEDLFEGITFCDYGAAPFVCKPQRAMFEKAMREAGVSDVNDCYFVDDSAINIKASTALGWKTAHLVEPGSTTPPPQPVGMHQIASLEELRTVFPEVFKS